MKELHTIDALKGELTITEFSGPAGPMLQLTQGLAGSFIGREGDLGAIQLTLEDASKIIAPIVRWMQGECNRRAAILCEKIAQDKALEQTIFSEAVKCENIVENFKVPQFCISLIAKLTTEKQ